MSQEYETRYQNHSQGTQPTEMDFSIEAIDGLWSSITLDRTNPTLTFEQSTGLTPALGDALVPVREVATDQATDLSEYALAGKLGEGGMGIIFDAKQTSLNRDVALKMLRSTSSSELQKAKFLAEAVLTGSLEHPNIISLHDLAVDQKGNLFYSMKKVRGEPWSETIRSRSLDENLDIFLRVCNAVAFAHSRNIVHRDIKPGNVMIGEFGEVLLMDWGLAVMVPPDRPLKESEFPSLGGTPTYMAPEMARGDFIRLSLRSDIYLLGAVLFEIVTKTPPHLADSVSEVLQHAANNVITPTKKQGELLAIARQAMATEPSDRFPSAMDFRTKIRNFQSHAQSMGLTRRAKKLAKRARQTNDYEMFVRAILTFQEAIDVWGGNKKAVNGMVLTRKYYAEAAIENGDLDLAATILEGDSLAGVDFLGEHRDQDHANLKERVRELKKDQLHQEKLRDKQLQDLDKWVNAFNGSPDIVVISRLRDGLIFEINDAFEKNLGYRRSEVIGRNAQQLDLWVDPEHRLRFIYTLEACSKIEAMETRIRRKDGEEIPVSMSACKLGFDGETAVITHARNISRSKTMEEELIRSQNRLHETQKLAKLGTWEFDVESERISWSEETFTIIGLSPDDGEPSLEGFLSTVHPDDVSKLMEAINSAQTDGKAYRLEVRHRQPDGAYKYILATGKPRIEDGKVHELFGSVMDISEFREA